MKLRDAFSDQAYFGRSDVMKAINLKPSRASELIKEMEEHGIIEPVTGNGKGKYRFRQQGLDVGRWTDSHRAKS